MLQTIYEILLAPFILALSLTGTPDARLGATLPSATAVFETSLASPITSSATSMTLASNSVRGGGSISGYNCFTIDEGSSQAETVCGTVADTAVTSMTRGISQSTGTTTVSALQFSHRRGANVKITDFPLIQILKAQNNGEDTFPNPITYDSGVSSAEVAVNNKNLASVEYVNSLSFGAIPAASETASGFVELATATESASSTSSGSAARLVLPASNATSTYNSATAGLKVVVTQNNGKIDDNFISTSTILTGQNFTFGSSTIIGSTNALDIGKNIAVITTTGTTTWPIPSGIKSVVVTVVGGGAGAGDNYAAGGGATAIKKLDVSATSSLTIHVGVGGTGDSSTGDNGDSSVVFNGTSYIVSNGGTASINTAPGGTSTGGDINIPGGYGVNPGFDADANLPSIGGSSHLGGSVTSLCTAGDCSGVAGLNYGGGGSGGDGTGTGGNGGQGVVIISY